MARNTCEAPWANRLDLRVSQTFRARGLSADLTVDVLNVLNLLDPSWGIVQVANPAVQLFRARRYDTELESVERLRVTYTAAIRRDRETGRPLGTRPFAPEVPTSQWRAQLGLRVRVGG